MDYFVNGLLGKVNGGMTGKDIMAIWQEYEDSVTLESQFVHDVDKIELILQMFEYEKSKQGKLDLGEFTWVATKIKMPEVKAWSDAVMKEREEFWKANGGVYTDFSNEGDEKKTEKREKHVATLNEYYGKEGK